MEQDYRLRNVQFESEWYRKQYERAMSEYSKYAKFDSFINRIIQIVNNPIDKIKFHKVLSDVKQGKYLNALYTGEERKRRIIVSMTSYPKRINKTPGALASMLNQTVKPDKIILWLANEDFPDRQLPPIFNELVKAGVSVEYRPNLKVHTKWYYAFSEYPDDLVITVDDDVIYRNDLVERLYKQYLQNPMYICSQGVSRILFSAEGEVRPFDYWDSSHDYADLKPSHQLFAANVAGTLYQPRMFCDETLNVESFTRLCPSADDVWLKIMEVMSGIKVCIDSNAPESCGMIIRGTQRGLALGTQNMIYGGNDRMLNDSLKAYEHHFKRYSLKDIIERDLDKEEYFDE